MLKFREMKVTIVQANLIWEDPDANIEHLGNIISGSLSKSDMLVLPEMFSTGFSMNAESLAETMNGKSVAWMKDLATSSNCAIAGSLIIKEKGKNYNRLIFALPDGKLFYYDKRHLFMMERENNFFTHGDKRVIAGHKGFSINLQICYDLRFPVWSRIKDLDYHAMIYVASWPEPRREVWNKLLVARAIENQCYVIGVNRVGSDGEGISYSGDSVIIGPKGEKLLETKEYTECIASAELSMEKLLRFRKKFPVWEDSDSFSLEL